jgi:dipeptidase D
MTRTSNPQGGEEVVERICAAGRLGGAEIELLRSYPPWRPDPGSELVASASRAFEMLHGAPPAAQVVHGGLECAVIGSLVPGLDMVSMGADIERLHAPGERVSITGTQRLYALLGATLDDLSA